MVSTAPRNNSRTAHGAAAMRTSCKYRRPEKRTARETTSTAPRHAMGVRLQLQAESRLHSTRHRNRKNSPSVDQLLSLSEASGLDELVDFHLRAPPHDPRRSVAM